MLKKYTHLFHISEIQNEKRLQAVFAVLWLGLLISFLIRFMEPFAAQWMVGREGVLCPSFFQSCQDYFFLGKSPQDLTFEIILALLGTGMFLTAWAAMISRWDLAHLGFLVLIIIKTWLFIFLKGERSINFESFHLLPAYVFLFSRNKLNDLRILLVLLYFLAGTVKFHEGWIAGTYFSTLKGGMPFVPFNMEWVFTNILVLLELWFVWFLLTPHHRLYKITLTLLSIMHIYSMLFVGYRYPIHALGLLAALFYHSDFKIKKPAAGTASLIILVLAFNIAPWLYPKDHKITYQGMALALNMFDANRQFVSNIIINKNDNKTEKRDWSASHALARRSPFDSWFRIQNICKKENVKSVAWTMDVSINGHPFRRVIHSDNACKLSYLQFSDNDWIRTDGPIVGYPGKNVYMSFKGEREPPEVFDTEQILRTNIESFLIKQSKNISWIYFTVSIIIFLSLLNTFKKKPKKP